MVDEQAPDDIANGPPLGVRNKLDFGQRGLGNPQINLGVALSHAREDASDNVGPQHTFTVQTHQKPAVEVR